MGIEGVTPTRSGKRKAGRPPVYDDARGRIGAAALALFADHGFEATSLGDIAAKAGVPKPNVLYYFSSKEELWRSVIDAQWSEIDTFFAAELSVDMPATRASLERVVRVFIAACQRFPAYSKIPAMEGNVDSWRTRWLAERHLSPHIALARRFHARLSGGGVIRPVDPLVFQTVMGGGVHLFFGQAQLWRAAEGSGRAAEEFEQLFVEGLLTLLCAEPAARGGGA